MYVDKALNKLIDMLEPLRDLPSLDSYSSVMLKISNPPYGREIWHVDASWLKEVQEYVKTFEKIEKTP